MSITNRIVTRGMGPSRGVPGRAGMVTQGYGGFFRGLIKAATRVMKAGQSGTKRALQALEEVIVGAKLIRVNGEKPDVQLQGHITVKVDMTRKISVMAEGLARKAGSAVDGIKIAIKRIL